MLFQHKVLIVNPGPMKKQNQQAVGLKDATLSLFSRDPGDLRETEALQVYRGHQGSRWERDHKVMTKSAECVLE